MENRRNMLLSLEKISKVYGDRLIFKDVSFSLEPGRIMLLTGPNGAGKSTLMKIIAGLSAPSSGKVNLNMQHLDADGPRSTPEGCKGGLGYMGHQTFIYPQLSAHENLLFWNRLHGLDCRAKTIEDALERVELKRFAHEDAGTFSRGMAQRLNLARLLLQSPALLLLDEPATGLDVRSRQILRTEIEAARERGASVIWITHTVEEDLEKADCVAELPGTPEKRRKGSKTAARSSFFMGTPDEYREYLRTKEAPAMNDDGGGNV